MSLGTRTILATLSLERLRSLCRDFNARQLWPANKQQALEVLDACEVRLQPLLDMLLYDELQRTCKVLGLDTKAHRREVLIARLMAVEAGHEDGAIREKKPERAPAQPPVDRG